MLSLTGCAYVSDIAGTDRKAAPAATSKPQATAQAAPPPAAPSKPEAQKPVKRVAGPKPPPAVPVETAPPAPSLQPIGLNEEALQKLLGQPSAIRDETPAKVLSFRRSECALNLTLYPDVETRVFRTLSYEVTSDDHDERTAKLCHARFGLPSDGASVAAHR
ncbi:hypothetical protein [Niveispirillum sp. KHB5.9]|uniref:hypothetical protein n=1 Tax=Niveispirillum sp. KHB5.9 TaxID=3400269 RepID=UPI003A88C9E1